ncbi:MAG TPA: hypothetical protein P5136_06430 [Methanofastidiosum sp.]|nr:hypothetical protein [Methanofastidiosum sp.]
MGGSTYSHDVYTTISSSHVGKSRADIFMSRTLDSSMSPNGVTFREARDSDAHPESLPIIVGLDETGSMGSIPENLCRGKLGTLIETMLSHNVNHPAVMFMGIGDHYSDKAPLQIGQFESGAIELNKWLTTVWLEHGGGGQNMESYLLAWLMAGRHTSTDHFEKRGKRGYLFTIGDEKTHPIVEGEALKHIMGYKQTEDLFAKNLLAEAQRMYEVFHIHANEGSYRDDPEVIGSWNQLLGERLLVMDNQEAIAELIASTVSVLEGANLKDVVKNFDKATAASVTKALEKVTPGVVSPTTTKGAMKL